MISTALCSEDISIISLSYHVMSSYIRLRIATLASHSLTPAFLFVPFSHLVNLSYLFPRMDLSSPTDCAAGGFDDLFTPRSMQTSSEDVHNRSLSSDTSSSGGRETSARLDRWALIRANAVMFCTCYSYTLIDHCLFMIGLIWFLPSVLRLSLACNGNVCFIVNNLQSVRSNFAH